MQIKVVVEFFACSEHPEFLPECALYHRETTVNHMHAMHSTFNMKSDQLAMFRVALVLFLLYVYSNKAAYTQYSMPKAKTLFKWIINCQLK